MTAQRYQRVVELFHAALELEPEARSAFLAQACASDEELRREAEAMLAADAKSGGFLDKPADDLAASAMRPGDHRSLIGRRFLGYEVVSQLGAGGMGEVYLARDSKLKREVAVKVLPAAFANDRDRVMRFEREAQVLASLNHSNIAAIYGLEEWNGLCALVMELVEGPTLAERIAGRAMPLEQALPIAKQIAEALEAAHERGIVHRDLKPANIKLTTDGKVKVLDFGLAKRQEPAMGSPEDSPTLTSTQEGVILGTAAYMSPEQALGKPVDKRADIWAFGVVLWELLTGRRLFEGDSVTQTLAGVLKNEIDFDQLPGETPAAIRGLLRRCLDRDVKNRLRDSGEARIAIDTAFEPVESSALPPRARRPFGWIAAASVFALSLGALAFVHFRETTPQRQRFRFQINSPGGGNLLGFQLSPDGRFLGLATGEGLSAFKIWSRSLDVLDTRLQINRQGLTNFFSFLSWDGKNLAFQEGAKLYKIPQNGGAPIFLADVPQQISGGVWLDNGVIVFGTEKGVFRISSSGGTPVKIGDQLAGFPSWLPGRRFLYIGAKNGTFAGSLFAGSLDGGKPTQILPDQSVTSTASGSQPVYVPASKPGLPGHLLFLHGETLWAQSFDSDKLQLQGEAIPIEEQVSGFTASTNGVLVFQRAPSQDRVLTWLDRAGKRLQSVSKPFVPAIPVIWLSPNDSQAIVPIAGREGTDLWIADLNRNTLSRFTFNGSGSGIWSPDGRKVLWAASDGNRYLRWADGSGKDELLFKNPTCDDCFPNDWSPDGKFIAVSGVRKVDEKQILDIWIVPTEGDRKPYPYLQSRFATYWAEISPDNRWMAYVSDEGQSPEQIVVESIPAGKGRWQISTETGRWPAWRRDGKELYYIQGTKLMAVPIRLTGTSVESGKPEALFEVQAGAGFQASRDGQRFLIALPVEDASASRQLTVDTDWRAGLKHSSDSQ